MHSVLYPENLYLITLLVKYCSSSIVVWFQESRESLDYKLDYTYRFKYQEYKLASLSRFLNVNNIVQFKLRFVFFLRFYVIPFLYLGSAFSPLMNPYTGKVFSNTKLRNLLHSYEVYKPVEANYARLFYHLNCVNVVNHPITSYIKDFPVGLSDPSKALALPSYAFLEAQLAKAPDNISFNNIISNYLSVWNRVVNALASKGITMDFKPHPATSNDQVWLHICSKLSEISSLSIIKQNVSAESLILSSRYILSDVSSVLWWTSFIPDRFAFSLDLFSFEGGDELKSYDGIIYISSISSLLDELSSI